MYHEVGLLCAFFACAGFLWVSIDPCWKKTSADVDVQPYDICYGLWKTCTISFEAVWLCEPNLSQTPWDLDIPARIQYNRATVIIACILTSFGLFIGGTSSDCCRIARWTEKRRGRNRCLAGWMWILAALLTAVGASWWAYAIMRERIWYKVTSAPGIQYTVNRGIYLVWGADLLNIVAGVCFTLLSENGCCNTGAKDSYDDSYRYERKITKEKIQSPKAEVMTEYV